MTDTTTASPAPGWYPDPHDTSRVRYWSGADWTATTAPSAAANGSGPREQDARPPLLPQQPGTYEPRLSQVTPGVPTAGLSVWAWLVAGTSLIAVAVAAVV